MNPRLALHADLAVGADRERLGARSPEEIAIARSVLYAAVFDYPLTLAELRQTLIESVQTPSEIRRTYAESLALQDVVGHRDGFYFPAGRGDLVAERRRREVRSRAFLDAHAPLLRLISRLPFVAMVALSGSVAHLNLDGDGDVDLFIVTRGRRVWSVTVLVVLLAKVMGRRRTLCANFVVAHHRLAFDQQDLFTASQIIHLKPLIGDGTFRRLVAANPFVRRFYPNFHESMAGRDRFRRGAISRAAGRTVEFVLALPWTLVEVGCRLSYRAYLSRRAATWKSPEQVRLEDDCLKLHTQSHRRSVLDRFARDAADLLGD
jgi:hypothetical protein